MTRYLGSFALATMLLATPQPMELAVNSTLTIAGTSTVRGFTCRAGKMDGRITGARASGTADLAAAVESLSLTIPVAEIGCGNAKMDEHMRKALMAEKHAVIRYDHKSHKIDGETLTMDGTLTIAGTARPLTLDAELSARGDGTIRVRGQKEIRMSEWGVKPPSLMMGTLKVRDPVQIHFDMILK